MLHHYYFSLKLLYKELIKNLDFSSKIFEVVLTHNICLKREHATMVVVKYGIVTETMRIKLF